MAKPKVFLPQVPSRIDKGTRLWVPTINLEPAKRFGELVTLMPPEANRLHDSPDMLTLLRAKMLHFTENDFVCCVGDPGLIAFAAITASHIVGKTGTVQLLKWDRFAGDGGDYIVLRHKP